MMAWRGVTRVYPAWLRRIAVLALLAVQGCASGLTAPEPTGHLTRDMFVMAFNDVDAVYIREPDLESMALKSLNGLTKLDGKLSARENAGSVELTVDKAVIASRPYDSDLSPTGWGELTGDMLDQAMNASPILKATATETIFQSMLGPVVKDLDPYSHYSSAADAAENRASREGFGGIGVRISVEDDAVRVTSVMHYTPAERMGLKRGDVIIAIDGVSTKSLSQQDVVDRLRGPVDSKVSVTLRRGEQGSEMNIVLTRAHVVPETVSYRREGDVAYFRIYGFNTETTDSLKRAFSNAKSEIGAEIAGVILDLRENPGGLLNQSVSLANLFLSDGRIVSTHGRHPESHQYFDAGGTDVSDGLPIVVLVDGNSASASEIVAAALQDNGRAVVVGSTSFGKGTVQTVLPLPNKGEITLTWARFHAPSGYPLHGLGVLPNVCTVFGKNAEQLIKQLSSGELPNVPVAERNAADPEDDAEHKRLRALCPARTEENPIDLEVARRLLERPVLFSAALDLAAPFAGGLAALSVEAEAVDAPVLQ